MEGGPSQGREVVRKRQRDTHRDRQTKRHRETRAEGNTDRGGRQREGGPTQTKSCLNKANQSGLMG